MRQKQRDWRPEWEMQRQRDAGETNKVTWVQCCGSEGEQGVDNQFSNLASRRDKQSSIR